MRRSKFNWRINHQIQAPEVRVVGPDGKQIGVLKLPEALKEAEKLGLDLVEIAPNAKPPVTRIIELGKLKYEEDKKLRKEKKGSKGGDTKEVRFSPFIGEHDFNVRLERVEEFLNEKNKVRLAVVFKGRQLGSKEFGYKILKNITEHFGENILVDTEPKFLGKHLIMTISPTTKVKITSAKKN